MEVSFIPWSTDFPHICRYLLENIDWLEDDLGQYDNEFLLVDCPGQLELYTHFSIFKNIISVFQRMGYQVCCVYLLESVFLQDVSKFFSGVLSAMSAMVQLEIPHINVITKLDLVDDATLESEQISRFARCGLLLGFLIQTQAYFWIGSEPMKNLVPSILG
ncbi:hypothetical protein DI09_4p200 [Mitosporidium daphniae]|uniref:GPN-loop GTPase 3 n=1 Tax=Mitosporidium daphniae TaxID=1485682 RepID=A0A098VPG3_9MICR|nr:uncharacterized protein DI09_4p200 [Mitosporidium daphniae]KGG50937.1 hypothetical protein DI09_4p200 [Mitosporidium daphniae]|eukprot:XP_013237364.1 uncharacterized protein DI09_4p200 [Mitosporidium daphniae]